MDKNSVLSYCPSEEALIERQNSLRNAGMNVISALTPSEARFEIEMGRCGNLLICYRLSSQQIEDIAKLYKRYCPEGRIIFVTGGEKRDKAPQQADASVPESSGSDRILQALRAA
jgi:hypothetical protein